MRFFLPIVVVIVFLNCVGAQPPPVPPDTLETLKIRTDKMERYVSFKVTQSIFKYTGNPNGIIRGVSRTVTEDKYKFPGGLVGVTGWRSELYRHFPLRPKEYIGMIGVKNSFGNFQDEAAYLRVYPDGSEFDDVLINTKSGKVFEHRIAEKINGKWSRYVAYRNYNDFPKGYVPPKRKECSTCHKDAASGGYGVGLAPGGDEIFSDPYSDFPSIGEDREIPLQRR